MSQAHFLSTVILIINLSILDIMEFTNDLAHGGTDALRGFKHTLAQAGGIYDLFQISEVIGRFQILCLHLDKLAGERDSFQPLEHRDDMFVGLKVDRRFAQLPNAIWGWKLQDLVGVREAFKNISFVISKHFLYKYAIIIIIYLYLFIIGYNTRSTAHKLHIWRSSNTRLKAGCSSVSGP